MTALRGTNYLSRVIKSGHNLKKYTFSYLKICMLFFKGFKISFNYIFNNLPY